MSAALDMTLDDIIKNNKKPGSGNSRGRSRPGGPGPARRLPNRAANRVTPYDAAKVTFSIYVWLFFLIIWRLFVFRF